VFRVALKGLLSRKLRLLLTVAAIVLGVAFVTGSLVLTDTSSRIYDDLFTETAAGVDLVVRQAAEFESAMGVEVEHDPLPLSVVDTIRDIDGVAGAEGAVKGQALLAVPGGDAIVPRGTSIGASWLDPPYGAFAIRDGRSPAGEGEVVIDAATAAGNGWAVGDQVTVQAHAAPETFEIVGIAGFGERDGVPGSTVALFDLPLAQRLLDITDGVSEVLVVADNDVPATTLRDQLTDTLGGDLAVTTSQDTAAASAAAAKDQLGFLRIMLIVLAITALLVGSFLIANTFAIVVGQRTSEFAMLRAIGATTRQVRAAVLTEALVLGIVASALGTVLGVGAATGLRALTAAFGVALPEGPLIVTGRTILAGLVIGVVVTVLAAFGPARRASRITPVEAMRTAASPQQVSLRRRVIGGVVATAGLVLLAVIVTGIIPSLSLSLSLSLLGVAGLLCLTALAILAPVFAGRLAGIVGRPLARTGVPGRCGRDAASRAPRRTAATSVALALGLAVVAFMTVLAGSLKASITNGYDEAIRADYVIESSRNEMLGGLSPHLYHHLSELPEVGAITRMRFGHWHDAGATEALTAVDPATLTRIAELDMVVGELGALDAGGVILAQRAAEARGLNVGDELVMTFARTGDQSLPIIGLLEDGDEWAVSTSFLVGLDTYATHFTEDVDATVMVQLADGVSAQQGERAIRDALADFPTATVRNLEEARLHRTQQIDLILGLVTVLLLLAVGIALLGITNTLALSIVERTREIGLLRAVGMTRRQVGAMIRWEALLVAVLGGVLGIAFGVAFGWVAVRALANQGTTIQLAVPGIQLLAYLGIAGIAGLLAGVVPARRAANLDVLQAIAFQ
jgi:putative ABC transport system permease protein